MDSQEQQQQQSYQYLEQEINRLQKSLFHNNPNPYTLPSQELNSPDSMMALDHLCASFQLSENERILVVLCAGWELRENLRKQYSQFLEESVPDFPTLRLIQKLLPHFNDSLLKPHSPLHQYHLVEPLLPSSPLPESPLKLDRWVLYTLMGYDYQDPSYPITLHPLSL